MIKKKEIMTSKDIKTLLFAGIIAAMILPFSAMDFAVAEEDIEVQDQKKLDALKNRYEKLQTKIDNSSNEKKISKWKEIQTKIIAKAMKINDKYNNGDAIVTAESTLDEDASVSSFSSSSYGTISITSSRTGCDQNSEAASAHGYVVYGNDRFYLTHNYANPISTGSFPNCIDQDWNDQLKIYADNIWNTQEGCYGYFSVSSYGTNMFICPGDTFDQGEWWYFKTTGYYESSLSWPMSKQHIL